ncbi:MAG: N-acetylmuramoyl-L-alanine amidase AmiC precursor, partial [Pseudomonadota bacterium]
MAQSFWPSPHARLDRHQPRCQLAGGPRLASQRLLTDYSRVTLESDVALKTKYTFVPSPPRLAIDIEGLELNPSIKEWVGKIKPDDPNITGVRVAQNSPGVVRMVFDLKQAV